MGQGYPTSQGVGFLEKVGVVLFYHRLQRVAAHNRVQSSPTLVGSTGLHEVLSGISLLTLPGVSQSWGQPRGLSAACANSLLTPGTDPRWAPWNTGGG